MKEAVEAVVIGIVGGMGPSAGIDLHQKIISLTKVKRDQDHLPVVHVSLSGQIGDRSQFLLGAVSENPAKGILKAVDLLLQSGATVLAMPCNTAHAPTIFDRVRDEVRERAPNLVLLHMIEEVTRAIRQNFRAGARIGLLATDGTLQSGVYEKAFEAAGLAAVIPDPEMQCRVRSVIYDPDYGVKARSTPVTQKARAELAEAMDHLIARDVACIVLACTELPLVISGTKYGGAPLIDATRILAAAMIRAFAPDKLRIE